MKKLLSMVLVLILVFTTSNTTFAANMSNNSFDASYLKSEKDSVSSQIVDSILARRIQPYTDSNASVLSVTEITTEEIDSELSHIYLDIEKAQKAVAENSSEENADRLIFLTERKDLLEATMVDRGFTFLTDEEAYLLLGGSSISTQATGVKPDDTSNTRYVASTIVNVALSDGRTIPYYYITAYSKSTNSTMVAMPSIAINADKKSAFIDALIDTYVGKVIGEALSYIPIISWLPYEMITFTTDREAASSYTVEAVYTTTPKFIWAYSSNHGTYNLEGVVHSTHIADHHVMRYSYNGKSQIDSADKTYTYTSPKYSSIGLIVKDQWETDASTAYIECVQDVRYYYQSNKNNSATRKLVSTQAAPYARGLWSMN